VNVPQQGNSVLLNSEETKELLVEGANSTWERVCGSSKGNFSATDEKIMHWVRMEIMAGCNVPQIVHQYFKATKCWTVGFVHHEGLAGCWRITLTQKLTTGYPGSSIAYQLHIINLHKKHYWLPVRTNSSCKRIKINSW
jgi:hypothetical protein